jgi:Enoyl-(Acyl carrier protein) reductase
VGGDFLINSCVRCIYGLIQSEALITAHGRIVVGREHLEPYLKAKKRPRNWSGKKVLACGWDGGDGIGDALILSCAWGWLRHLGAEALAVCNREHISLWELMTGELPCVLPLGLDAVATPINLSTMKDPALMKKLDAAIPLGRMAQPEEIGSVVAFLAADGAGYITATTIFADGGIMHSSPGL